MTDETPASNGTPEDEQPSPELLALAADWEACLAYFHQAVHEPLSVATWSEWWAEWEERAAKVFSMVDYVRLKHRRLKGARQILQLLGRLEQDYVPPQLMILSSCPDCGERTKHERFDEGGGRAECPRCGSFCRYD